MVIIRYASASSPVFFLYLSNLTTVWLSTKNSFSWEPSSGDCSFSHTSGDQKS